MKPNTARQPALEHSEFFALRTPLLPWDEFVQFSEGLTATADGEGSITPAAIAADRALLRERLRQQLDRPEVLEAVFVASPSLYESLELWRQEPDSPRGQKTERALMRYFARMTGRPTPFGLFAGCSVGSVGEQTRLEVEPLQQYRRHTRLDTEYVLALAEELTRHPALRWHLSFHVNTSLYRAAGQVRYAESRFVDGQRSHHLVAVDDNEYLSATLQRAGGGGAAGELAAALVDDEITLDEATAFVDELIDAQILVSDLQPAVTGREPIHWLIDKLESLPPAAAVVEQLRSVRDAIDAIDDNGRATADDYQRIAAALENLPGKVELPRLFQVDMHKPAPRAAISPAVIDELQRGVELLSRLNDRETEDSLSQFRDAFLQRYEQREVPLVEALDEEIGIGFERSTAPAADGGPLLAGIAIPQQFTSVAKWQPRHAVLLEKLMASRDAGSQAIELTADDVQQMAAADPAPLPGALSASATLSARSPEAIANGDFQMVFINAGGPSGAKLLGRFCHGDELLERRVREHLLAEEALAPEAVFAELVHLPEGRLGNVLLRPVLREYELSYLGCSGAAPDKQIPVTDLLVSVRDGRVVLRSAALDREVMPRLSSAHNFAWKGLPIYKFLGAVQHQQVASGLYWDWGPLASLEFLPRVTHGRLVLSRARWLVSAAQLKSLTAIKDAAALFKAVQAWRVERKLPRYVALQDSDNELPVDLENILSIESLVDVLRGREQATLVEMLPAAEELPASGPEGRFMHELVVPMVRRRSVEAAAAQTESASDDRLMTEVPPLAPPCEGGELCRRFGTGSEWLYVKVYAGPAVLDRLLRNVLREPIEAAVASGACDRWFFLRYNDPDSHLRLRLHGKPQRLLAEVLPRLESALREPLEAGWVSRVQYDTYEREVERYGGDEGVQLSEELFHADSEAALAIVALCDGDLGLDARWRLALRGVDQWLDDLGFATAGKLAIMQHARDGFAQELGVGAGFKQQASARFRRERANLESLLDPAGDDESLLAPALAAMHDRSLRVRPLAARLSELAASGELSRNLSDLALSYVHMWVNRVLRSAHRAQELVLYDFLVRLYQSSAARSRSELPATGVAINVGGATSTD